MVDFQAPWLTFMPHDCLSCPFAVSSLGAPAGLRSQLATTSLSHAYPFFYQVSALIHTANRDYKTLIEDLVSLEVLPADTDRGQVR